MNATHIAEQIQISVEDSGGPRLCLLNNGRLLSYPPSTLIGVFTGTSTKAQIVALVKEAIDANNS